MKLRTLVIVGACAVLFWLIFLKHDDATAGKQVQGAIMGGFLG